VPPFLLCLLVSPLTTLATLPIAAASAMEQRIATLLKDFKGNMGVAAVDLVTGETIAVNADTRFPTASTIKTAVMVEAYHQAAEGALSLDAILTLAESDKVGGSGVLSGMRDGLPLTVRELIHLMIVVSDNTATNILVTRLGTARISARMANYGLRDTKLFRPTFRDGRADVFPELEREFGLGMTTPREMAALMALIARGKAVSPAASAAMLATLRRQQDRAMIARLLPDAPGLEVGSKSGTDAEKQPDSNGVHRHLRADAAIVTAPGLHYVIAVYARQVEDTRRTMENEAVVTGARISRLIYDHFRR
jgi:beta-lactamase class A